MTKTLIAALTALTVFSLQSDFAYARHGADDPAGHVRHGRGKDDASDARRHGQDDGAGHVRHGGDDGPNHK